MSDGIELEQVLRRAIAAEYSAASFYTTIADAAGNAEVSAVFRELADDERVHAVAIEAVGDRFTGAVQAPSSTADFAAIEAPPGWEGERIVSLGRAFELAQAAEVNAAQVYDTLAATLEGKTAQLFAGLARSERSHAARLHSLTHRCSDTDLARQIELDPALQGASGEGPGEVAELIDANDSIWESGEDLITHSTMATNDWGGAETVAEATPSSSGSSVLRRVLGGHRTGVRHMAFSADGRFLVTVDEASEVFVWSTTDGHLVTPLDAPTDGVAALAFSPDGHTVAIGSPSGGVTLWDLSTLSED